MAAYELIVFVSAALIASSSSKGTAIDSGPYRKECSIPNGPWASSTHRKYGGEHSGGGHMSTGARNHGAMTRISQTPFAVVVVVFVLSWQS